MNDASVLAAMQLFEQWAAGKWGAQVLIPEEAAPLVAAVKAALKRGRDEELALRRKIEVAVDVAADSLARVVIQGDLTQQPLPPAESEGLAALYDAVNQSAILLRDFVQSMKAAASDLGQSSRMTHGLLEQSHIVLDEQATTAQELASTLAELKGTSVEIERSANAVAELSKQSQAASSAGSSAVQAFSLLMSEVETNVGMVSTAVDSLSGSVLLIDRAIQLITEVADRSDMLALNAALEAARAGHSGRGFAIVAEEMRRLSARVVGNTTEITELITGVRQATDRVRERAGATIEVATTGHTKAIAALENFGGIIEAVHQTALAAQAISIATGQQRASTTQAAGAVSELSEEVRQAASGTEKTRASAERLSQLASRLELLVSRFTTITAELDPRF